MSFVPITLENQLPFRIQKIQFSGITAHWHDSLEILCITEGKINLLIENQTFKLEEDDIIVNNATKVHEVTSIEGDSQLIAIQIPYLSLCNEFSRYCPGIEKMMFSLTPDDRDRDSYQRIAQLIKTMYRYSEDWEKNQMELCADLYHILQIMSVQYKVDNELEKPNLVDNKVFVQILHYIQNHYTEKISREKLGSMFGYSSAYISQLFQRNTGYSLLDYMNQLRVENAYKDIIYTDKTITYISENNGFSSLKYFNKCFCKAYGATPKEFRAQYKTMHEVKWMEEAAKKRRMESQNQYNIVHDKKSIWQGKYGSQFWDGVICRNMQLDVGSGEKYHCIFETILFCGYVNELKEGNVQRRILRASNDFSYEYALIYVDSDILGTADDFIEAVSFLHMCGLVPCIVLSMENSAAGDEKRLINIMDQLKHLLGGFDDRWLWGIHFESINSSDGLSRIFSHIQSRYGVVFGIVFSPEQSGFINEVYYPVAFSLCIALAGDTVELTDIKNPVDMLLLVEKKTEELLEEAKAIFRQVRSNISVCKSISLQCIAGEQYERRPHYYLKRFLCELNGAQFILDQGCIVALKDNNYTIMMETDQKLFYKDITIRLNIKGARKGEYLMHIISIDEQHGSPYELWKSLDCPIFLKQKTTENMLKVAGPKQTMERCLIDSEGDLKASVAHNGLHVLHLEHAF